MPGKVCILTSDLRDSAWDHDDPGFEMFEEEMALAPLSDRLGRDPSCKVSVVIPAKNEGLDIAAVVKEVGSVLKRAGRPFMEVTVVDDGSSDRTREEAEAAGARVIRHPSSLGNGAAVKAGFRAATGDVVVLIDGDGQHDPADIPRLLDEMTDNAMVVGARSGTTKQSFHRKWANRIYNVLASYVASSKIPDLTSGFRAVRTDVARRYLYLLPNTFSYPSTLTLSFLRSGHSVGFVPIVVRPRRKESSSKIRIFQDGSRFFLLIMRVATVFSPFKVFLPISLAIFSTGIGYYLYTYLTTHRFTNMGLLLVVLSAMMFSLGLISEQISSLRFDRSEDQR